MAAAFEALELLLQAGAKWEPDDARLKSLRRSLVEGESVVVVGLLDLISKYGAMSVESLNELTRTPAVRRVLDGHTKPFRDPFAVFQAPVAVTRDYVSRPTTKGGYWKRHWSQRR